MGDPLHPAFAGRELPSRAEATTVGVDEVAQLIGADPFGRQAGLGLRIPELALANATPQLSRYLFLLAYLEVPEGRVARIRGYRQLVTLGANVGTDGDYRPVEKTIEDPWWHPVGANISWHLQHLGVPGMTGLLGIDPSVPPPLPPVDNFAFKMAKSPALLYQSATLVGGYYINLTAYTPPNGGQPPGKPLLEGGYATRYDLSASWRSEQAWHSLDVPLYGPVCVGLFASVRQANVSAPGYALTAPTDPGATNPQDRFLSAYPTAAYWRIAASLVVDS
jgi:hypothetical protein